jgi:sugar lactone lactonase YvrE
MHSLSQHSPALEASLKTIACVAALVGGAVACSDSEDGAGTVALADSGSLAALTDQGIEIPTTVAVANGVAWIPESQFTQFPPFNQGVGTPAPFRLVGIPLDGGSPQYINLPNNFFPEGITATSGGRLFVGSVAEASIYTVAPDATEAVPFLAPGMLQNAVIGVTTDGTTVWACNTFFGSMEPPALPTGTIVGIGIADGLIKVRHQMPPGGSNGAAGAFCNDLVVSPDGAVWATDSFGGRLFRIDPENLLTPDSAAVWLEDTELAGLAGPAAGSFGVNGITLLGGQIFVVNSASGALLRIDPSLASPTGDDLERVFLTQNGGEVDLVTPDGITAVGERQLLVIENGFNPPVVGTGKRLVQVTIDAL